MRVRIECGWNLSASGFLSGVVTQRTGFCPGGDLSDFPSNLCEVCQCNIETIEHLFWECATVQNLARIFYPIKVRYLQPVKIQNTVINNIIVLMKYFIFNMKCRLVYLTFDIFQKMLKMKVDIEKEIAFMCAKYSRNCKNH